jgi:DNA replication protein DnaC
MMSFLWSSLSSKFEFTVKNIARHTLEFEKEAALAHDVAASRHRNIVEDALPLFVIQPKTTSNVFSVPFNRNHKFFGRQADVDLLRTYLQSGDTRQKSCTLHGIGGVGKTQLAQEFAYQFKDDRPYIFWLRAQDDPSLAVTFSEIARLLSLLPPGATDQLQMIDAVRTWLLSSKSKSPSIG